jgi:hypothetical protein
MENKIIVRGRNDLQIFTRAEIEARLARETATYDRMIRQKRPVSTLRATLVPVLICRYLLAATGREDEIALEKRAAAEAASTHV